MANNTLPSNFNTAEYGSTSSNIESGNYTVIVKPGDSSVKTDPLGKVSISFKITVTSGVCKGQTFFINYNDFVDPTHRMVSTKNGDVLAETLTRANIATLYRNLHNGKNESFDNLSVFENIPFSCEVKATPKKTGEGNYYSISNIKIVDASTVDAFAAPSAPANPVAPSNDDCPWEVGF